MAQYKTPGVYIQELNAFPNSVVEVPTAIPAFIGYTEKAQRGQTPLTGVPTRISSLAEYHLYFGGPPPTTFDVDADTQALVPKNARFLLYTSLRLFFDNGGGPCWITAVGDYAKSPTAADLNGPFDEALLKEEEPTMIVIPDAVLLPKDEWAKVSQQALKHCAALTSRIAILDVYRDPSIDDPIKNFRNTVTDGLSYGVAYWPWLHTSILELADVTPTMLEAGAKAAVLKAVTEEASGNTELLAFANDALGAANPPATPAQPGENAGEAGEPGAPQTPAAAAPETSVKVMNAHRALLVASASYRETMAGILKQLNELPPSAGIAGVYARIDSTLGVFKAPANTGLNSVVAPVAKITSAQQEDLNVPLNGKAINAIRAFPGRGVLIWGARTLDGNSQDWRYINVRRTLIMLEQSVKYAAQSYVFAPNNAATWLTMRHMIENYLQNKWKEGALVGATPAEAYSVDVGLGSTMTANDILDGYMLITVKVAVVRPAEFIVITFQQKMQTS